MTEPRSFESEYYLGAAPWHVRLWRDLRLIASSVGFVWMWMTLGRRVRREVADAEQAGQLAALEDLFDADRPT